MLRALLLVLMYLQGDQYDVREKDGERDVRNLGKPVELAARYFEDGADEVRSQLADRLVHFARSGSGLIPKETRGRVYWVKSGGVQPCGKPFPSSMCHERKYIRIMLPGPSPDRAKLTMNNAG